MTDTSKIQAVVSSYNSAMGGTVSAAIPGGTSAACSAYVANGTIDILVNIANNKGHTMMGNATLSMKNHFGTFAPDHDNNYVFNINKSDAILGGTPPRQQLCFIDSLIANKVSNQGTPESIPCYLIMGVFGPIVDYLTVKNIREAIMGCTHTESVIDSYVTTFGYATTDPVWVLVPPATTGISEPGPHENASQNFQSFEVALSNNSNTHNSARFSIPNTVGSFQVQITDMNGRVVRAINIDSLNSNKIFLWDGKTSSGRTVSPGNYAVKIHAGNFEQMGRIIIA